MLGCWWLWQLGWLDSFPRLSYQVAFFVLCLKSLSSFCLCLKHPNPLRSNSVKVMLASLSLHPLARVQYISPNRSQDGSWWLSFIFVSFDIVSWKLISNIWKYVGGFYMSPFWPVFSWQYHIGNQATIVQCK